MMTSYMSTQRRLFVWPSNRTKACEDHDCQLPDAMVAPRPPVPTGGSGVVHNQKLLLVAAVLSAFLLLSLIYLTVLRRYRGRRGWLFRPIYFAGDGDAAASISPSDGDAISADDGVEQPLHHVWYIRTMGLDEATINSIAVTEYRSTGGFASDCSVCLGEFTDGELVRLLPKCGHSFHVPCIDTWLRANLKCPLCRALIVDTNPQPDAATVAADPPPETAAAGSMDANSESSRILPEPQPSSEPLEEEQGGSLDCVIVIIAPVNLEGDSNSSLESSEAMGQADPENLLAPEAILHRPEESLGGDEDAKDAIFGEEITPKSKGRQGYCSKGASDPKAQVIIERSLSSSGRGFIFSRHGRYRRNSSLPL